MTPLQIIGLFFVLFCIAFYFLVLYGARYTLKYFTAYPSRMGVFIDEAKKFFYYPLKATGLLSTDWKLQSTNPSKVRFKVRSFGIGKAHEMEWDRDDYIEIHSRDSNKIFVLFGLRNFDLKMALEHKLLMQNINSAVANSSLWKQKYYELETRFNEKVNEALDRTKKLAPVYVKPKLGGTTR